MHDYVIALPQWGTSPLGQLPPQWQFALLLLALPPLEASAMHQPRTPVNAVPEKAQARGSRGAGQMETR